MFELKGSIHAILPHRAVKRGHYIIPIIFSHKVHGVEDRQYRYMQIVSNHIKEQLLGIDVGDAVKIKVAMKGKEVAGKFHNLDEILSIEKI